MTDKTYTASRDDVPTAEELGDIIRIVDPEIDVDAIMAEIRDNLASRPPLDPDPSKVAFVNEVDRWLIEEANGAIASIRVGNRSPEPTGGFLSRLSIRAKVPLHQLSQYYVDLLAANVMRVDNLIVSILMRMTERAQQQRNDVSELQAQVALLRTEINVLKAAVRQPEANSPDATQPL